MNPQLQMLLMLIKHEPRGFLFKIIKNGTHYFLLKYVFRKKFAVQRIHSYKMKLSLHDPGISRTLFLTNDREREHAYLLNKITSTGDSILDLGANIGYYALMESHLVGATGKIIAVEPHPQNYKLLQDNVALNNTKNVETIHAAVTDHDGSTMLHVSKLSNVHSVLPSVNYSSGESVSVPSISIATLAEEYPDIKVIRMDIEGYETVILNAIGEINKQKSFKPSILFELHAKKYEGNVMTRLLTDLSSFGYYVRYLATSDKKTLRTLDLRPVSSISTDGKIRHVVQNLSIDQALQLIPKGRCMVLSAL